VIPEPVVCTLDSDGYLTYESQQYVSLLATNDTSINPTNFTYTVSFNLTDPSGNSVSISPFSIEVPANTTVDLTSLTPVPASGGTFYTQGPAGPPGVLYTTSNTTMTVHDSGLLVFTTASALTILPGATITVAGSAAPAVNWMTAIITNISGTSVQATVTAAGSGGLGNTASSWNVSVSGGAGPAGNNATIASSTSTTTLTIGTGTVTLNTAQQLDLNIGAFMTVAYVASPSNFMYGQITSIAGNVVTIAVTATGGSGTFSAWAVSASGVMGPTGPTGATGPTGPSTVLDAVAYMSNGIAASLDPALATATLSLTGSESIGTRIVAATSGNINNVLIFPASSTANGNLTARVWSPTAGGTLTLLGSSATTLYTGTGAGFAMSIALTSPVPVVAGTTYVVTVECSDWGTTTLQAGPSGAAAINIGGGAGFSLPPRSFTLALGTLSDGQSYTSASIVTQQVLVAVTG
jgi:hypothetical protein